MTVEPASPVPFEVGPNGSASREFTVTPGPGSFTAHYPIAAQAEFEHQGRRYKAHPILILPTKLPDPPRAAMPVEWKPIRVASVGVDLPRRW